MSSPRKKKILGTPLILTVILKIDFCLLSLQSPPYFFYPRSARDPVARNDGMPGEMGKAVSIPKDREEEKKEKFKINQFNLLASEMISLNRSLMDVRLAA